MSITSTYGGMVFNKKTLLAIAISAAVLMIAGAIYFTSVQNVSAVAPGDFGLKEGDTVSAAGSDDPDVYIVNEDGYKRLFLNPAIFGFYGHLGGFANVKNVSPSTRDAFPTSGLFRNCEVNDPKVYGVETTGEDVGMLHWVNTSGAQAVADDPNFFKKVFCINNNEFNWYAKGSDYTSVNQVPNYVRVPGPTTTPVVTGPLSVSLASDNPAAKTITLNATGVEFMKMRFSGSGTITSMTLKRVGAGQTDDFANVYVYDGAKRLVSGKTFSSSSGELTFLLNVAVSGTKDLSVVADMDATNNTAGNVNSVQLMSVAASGTVSGTPLNGNNVTSSGASSGGVTLVRAGSLSNPTVGQKGAQISEFKITANTEAASVRRLTMINGGTVKPGDMTNLKLKSGTNEWSGNMTTDGYAVFDLGSGFTIVKGGNAVFKMYADLAGKKDETIDLYFENDADTYAVGDQYGQGMAVTDTDIDAAGDVTDLTLQGGVLTIAFNGPTASNVATNATDVTMLRFSMTAASNLEVRKTEFVLCVDTAGGGFDNAADETEWDELNDFKVWNENTGQVVMGPKDGTAFNDTNDTNSCPDAATGAGETFTDVLDLAAGTTYSFKVTVDFDTSLGGTLTAADSIVKVILDRYDEDTPDLTIMKYAGTNTSVADADIVPNADVSGPSMTLKGSSLTLGLASSPADRTYIKGTTGTEFIGITFAAALGSGLKVTDITLTGYVEDESGDTHNEGVDTTDSGVSIANAVSSVMLYDGTSGALISNSPSSNQLSVINTGTIKFSGLNWVLAAGETKTLLVKANLSTNEASGSNGDRYAFDINTTTDVTAVDDSNNTVNAGNADPNGATAPTVDITVKNSGNLTVAVAPGTPTKAAVYWGQTGVTFSKFRFTTTDEGQYLERLNFNTGDTAADLTNNVNAVYLTYKNKAGSTLTANGSFNTAGSVSFAFTGDNRPYVPADSSSDVTVKADMKTKAQGATNNVNFSIDLSGGNADEFRSVGESGTVTDGADSDIVNRAPADNQYVYRVFPKITKVTETGFEANSTVLNPTEIEVLRFTVEAMGLSDSKLLFDNAAVGSGTIKFEIVASGVGVAADPAFKVYDAADGSSVDVNGTIDNAPDPSLKASITIDFTSKDIEIAGGSSKTFYMRADLTNFSHNGDYFQVILRDDEAALIRWMADADAAADTFDTDSTTGVLRQLELIGTSKVRNI